MNFVSKDEKAGKGSERPEDEAARLSRLFAQAPSIMALFRGPDHIIEFANDAYLEITGRHDVIGKPAREVLPEVEDQGLFEQYDQVYRTGERLVGRGLKVSIRRNPEGPLEDVVVDFIYEPVRSSDGSVEGIFVQATDVTERTRAEQELQLASEKAGKQAAERSAILGQLAEGVIITDTTGRIIFVNEAAKQLHGIGVLDVEPSKYSETYHLFREDGSSYPFEELPLTRAVLRGETVTDARWRIIRPDGTEVLAIGSAQPIRSPSGDQIGSVLTVRDDTARWAAESALREREDRLRLVIDAASDYAIFTTDHKRRVTSWSKGAEKIFGYSALEAIGMCADVLWTPEDRVNHQPEREIETAEAAGCVNDERWHQRKDGGRVFLNGSAHPLPPNEDGSERGFIKIARDETERRRTARALHESEQQLRLALDAAAGSFYAVDREGNTTLVSNSFIDMMGFAGEQDVIGRKLHGLIHHTHPDGRQYPVEECPIYRCAAVGESAHVPDELFFKLDGTPVPVEYWVSPVIRNGEHIGAICTILNITERKKAEEALRLKAAEFEALAENVSQLAWMAEPDGSIFWYNKRWYEYTDTDLESMKDWGWRDVHHPNHIERIIEEVRGRWEAGEPWEGTYLLRSAAGEYRWFLTRAEPIRDENGNLVRWFGTNTDITEQLAAQERQRFALTLSDRLQTESEPRKIVAAALEVLGRHLGVNRAGFGEVSPDGKTITFETDYVDGVAHLVGTFPIDDFGRGNMADLRRGLTTAYADLMADPRTSDGDWAAIETRSAMAVPFLREGRFSALLYLNRRNVGEWTPDEVTLVHDVAARVWDALERARAEESLREESRTLETLNRVGTALASELDLERVVQMVTDAGVELTGAQFGAFFYNVSDESGESYMLYTLSGADRSDFDKFGMPRNTPVFHSTFVGESVVRSDDITKDTRYGQSAPHFGLPEGHLPVTSYLAVPVIGRSGTVIGGLFFGHQQPGVFTERHERLMVGIAGQAAIAIDNAQLYREAQRELENRVEAEQALRALNENLEARVRAEIASRVEAEDALRQAQKMETVGQLSGGIAHDFNNLLQIIQGNLSLLEHGIPKDQPRLRRQIENALKGSKRAAALTQRLLAFSRRQPLAPRLIDANKLIAGMSEMLDRTLGEIIDLRTEFAPELWLTEADPNQLENAILNLAVNARDAMENGGRMTIETANCELDEGYAARDPDVVPGRYVLISISDEGPGMDPNVLKRAIEPFFTTKEVGRGTGLGLSMVYGFIKQSGGHFRLYSEPGHGTAAKIYLPRLGIATEAQAREEETSATAELPKGTETILLCEDDENVRDFSSETLSQLGYMVIESADAETALAVLRTRDDIDLLFTDVVLPGGKTGADLAAEARTVRPDLKVLFTTGYARSALDHQGRLDPGVELILKPFSVAEIAARLRVMLD